MKQTENGGSATLDRPQNQQRSQQGPNQSSPDKEEMMKKAEAAGRPGPGHKVLEHFVGDWKAEVKCWMEPGASPNVSAAMAKGTWIMNGRYLQEDFHGEMFGKPFHGQTILGFDNVTQKFSSVWISDMQTSLFKTEGKGDNKVITLEGKTNCPASERTDIPTKVVLRILSPDKHTFEMFDGSEGSDRKTMEITYTRK